MICVGIYAVLISELALSDDIIMSIWGIMGYTVLLCFTLFKTNGKRAYSMPIKEVADEQIQCNLCRSPLELSCMERQGKGRSAESHYSTMSIEDIKKAPIGKLADKDCALFMWITTSA